MLVVCLNGGEMASHACFHVTKITFYVESRKFYCNFVVEMCCFQYAPIINSQLCYASNTFS